MTRKKKISGTVSEGSDKDKDIEKTTSQEDNSDEEVRRKTVVRQTDNVVREECDKDVRKKTFSDIDIKKKKNVRENIRMFQDLVNGEECVSGMCCTHNVKLVRSVMMKKISSLDENGEKMWLMGEVVLSACPYKTEKGAGGASLGTEPKPLRFEGANGRKKFYFDRDMNQSAASQGDKFEREEVLLDETITTCRKTD